MGSVRLHKAARQRTHSMTLREVRMHQAADAEDVFCIARRKNENGPLVTSGVTIWSQAMHIDIGLLLRLWWKRPTLSETALRDVAMRVRRTGKGYFVERMRSEENRIVSPDQIVVSEGDLNPGDRASFSLTRSFLRAFWRSPLDKIVLVLSVALCGISVWYVGDPELWLYVGIPLATFVALYFGIVITSMWRYSRWLDQLIARYPNDDRDWARFENQCGKASD
jgi:hypothetical protein